MRLASFFWPWSKATWVFVIWTIAMIIASQIIAARVASICAGAADVAHCQQGETAAYSFTAYGLFGGAWLFYAAIWIVSRAVLLLRRVVRSAKAE